MKVGKVCVSLCIVVVFSIAGCSALNNNTANTKNETNTNTNTSTGGAVDLDEITKLTQQIQAEDQVLSVSASKSSDTATCIIEFKPDADTKNAKDFAEKYATLIKKAYKTQKANVKILQNKQSIAEATV